MDLSKSVELREMVRDILRDALAGRSKLATASPTCESIAISSDADLQALITRLARPGGIEAVRAGSLKFALATTPASEVKPRNSAPALPVLHGAQPVHDGVVSERLLGKYSPGSTVFLALAAVLTPLAKDTGRRLGLKFERKG